MVKIFSLIDRSNKMTRWCLWVESWLKQWSKHGREVVHFLTGRNFQIPKNKPKGPNCKIYKCTGHKILASIINTEPMKAWMGLQWIWLDNQLMGERQSLRLMRESSKSPRLRKWCTGLGWDKRKQFQKCICRLYQIIQPLLGVMKPEILSAQHLEVRREPITTHTRAQLTKVLLEVPILCIKKSQKYHRRSI